MTSFGIDPLIDGFMADNGAPVFFSEFPRDDFGGPLLAEPGFNLGSEGLAFKAGPAVTVLMADNGEKLSSERVVMLLGEVTPEFTRQGGMRPIQSAGDGSQ